LLLEVTVRRHGEQAPEAPALAIASVDMNRAVVGHQHVDVHRLAGPRPIAELVEGVPLAGRIAEKKRGGACHKRLQAPADSSNTEGDGRSLPEKNWQTVCHKPDGPPKKK
jgi:hypothetical protein